MNSADLRPTPFPPLRAVFSALVHPDPLAARAALLWPDSEILQAKWVRAVGVVRSTRGGWVLDRGSAVPNWGHGERF